MRTAKTSNWGCGVQGFLDLENLVGDYNATPAGVLVAQLSTVVRRIRDEFPAARLTGCGHRDLVGKLAPWAHSMGVRLFGGSGGADRADRELLMRLDQDLRSSCGTVLIGSGDHAFAPTGKRLRENGRRVIVVGLSHSVSWELYPASDRVILLDDPRTDLTVVA